MRWKRCGAVGRARGGLLTKGLAVASEESDKRSWQTLPDEIHLARTWVSPGTFRLQRTPPSGGAVSNKTMIGPRRGNGHCYSTGDANESAGVCDEALRGPCSLQRFWSDVHGSADSQSQSGSTGSVPTIPPGNILPVSGKADNRAVAEDQAYAALARIFKAEVSAQAKDWESYLVIEQRGSSRDERRLTLDNLTRVSTDKVLENVKIVDRWVDVKKGLHYASGGDASVSSGNRLHGADDRVGSFVQADVEEAHRTPDKLAKVRALRRAIRNLVLRETYNADLRVIRASGQGTHRGQPRTRC